MRQQLIDALVAYSKLNGVENFVELVDEAERIIDGGNIHGFGGSDDIGSREYLDYSEEQRNNPRFKLLPERWILLDGPQADDDKAEKQRLRNINKWHIYKMLGVLTGADNNMDGVPDLLAIRAWNINWSRFPNAWPTISADKYLKDLDPSDVDYSRLGVAEGFSETRDNTWIVKNEAALKEIVDIFLNPQRPE